MSNIDPIQDLEFDSRETQYRYDSTLTWPIHQPQQQQQNLSPSLPQNDMNGKRSISPLSVSFDSSAYNHPATYPSIASTTATMMAPHLQNHHQHHAHQQQQQHHDQIHHQIHHHNQQQQQQQQDQQHWQIPSQTPVSYPLDTTFAPQAFTTFEASFQTSPTEYATTQHPAMDQASFEANLHANVNATIANTMNAGIALDDHFTTMAFTDVMATDLHPSMDHLSLPLSWPSDYANLYTYDYTTAIPQQHQTMGSPVARSETYMSETLSTHSWEYIEAADHQDGVIFNPQQALHPRTFSDSSSDVERHSRTSLDGFVDMAHSISSPSNDSGGELVSSDQDCHQDIERLSPTIITRSIMVPKPKSGTQIDSSPPQRGPTSPKSRGGRPRRSTATAKAGPVTKPVKKTGSASPKEGEKRVGKRKGPLREDQRKQACEIRKLGACIRCRFLKKTCDPGNPCAGCQPSHARLWIVPCTRIDIKDLGYFVKDWKADFERHVSLGFSVGNIKGFSEKETTLFITHGYGHFLPVSAREIYVRDDRVFGVDWVEADHNGVMSAHEVNTARMTIGEQGISNAMISDYLDRHIDSNFEGFVDEFFMGSPFFPEILKVVHRFYQREKTPVIRKALKFVLAYNLTQSVCLVKPVGEEQEQLEGAIPEESYYHGNVAAPVMINFSIKCAMADQWRSLQQEVLSELSSLYTRVYSKDKLKHWPTIFMIASILLVVWEEMQFDCRYRIQDKNTVDKFCKGMTDTPVGVIIGLFSAISQKIPSFLEWDTHKHQESLNSDPSVCKTMEEVRDEIKKNGNFPKFPHNRTILTIPIRAIPSIKK